MQQPFHLAAVQYSAQPRSERDLAHDRFLDEARGLNAAEQVGRSGGRSWWRFLAPRPGTLVRRLNPR
jgi:hypothetical protein